MRNLRRNVLSTLAAGAVAVLASPAALADYSCGGPVNGVTVSGAGVVSAESAGGTHWTYFCQLGATTNGVDPEACKGILAVLLTAQASGKSVNLWFNDSLNCSADRSWAWLAHWYWGPSIQN
jgi:hypothetical protein